MNDGARRAGHGQMGALLLLLLGAGAVACGSAPPPGDAGAVIDGEAGADVPGDTAPRELPPVPCNGAPCTGFCVAQYLGDVVRPDGGGGTPPFPSEAGSGAQCVAPPPANCDLRECTTSCPRTHPCSAWLRALPCPAEFSGFFTATRDPTRYGACGRTP